MARQSPKMKQAIRLWQEINSSKQDTIQRKRGILGNGRGVVRVPGRPDLVYMRINADSTRIWQVLNDRVADTNGLAVIAEKHPDAEFWEIIDVDKQALSQVGTGLAGLPYRQTHSTTHEWPDYAPGIDAVNVFRRAQVDLRTEPIYSGYSLDVYVRPVVYSYQGQVKRFEGGTLSLTSYVPDSGVRNVLTYLDVRTNYIYGNPGSVTSYAVSAVPNAPLLPWYAKKSALVTLRQNQNIINEPDIEDIREERLGLIHNMQSSRTPTVDDDALRGYSEGSVWIYGTSVYFCTNPAIGASVWTSPGGNVWPKPGKVNIGNTEYENFTDAYNAASSGDVIRFGEGTYVIDDTITISKSVVIIGNDRYGGTYLYATSGNAALALEASCEFHNISISGIEIGAVGYCVMFGGEMYDIVSAKTGSGRFLEAHETVFYTDNLSYPIEATDGSCYADLYDCRIFDGKLEGTATTGFNLYDCFLDGDYLPETASYTGTFIQPDMSTGVDSMQFNLTPSQIIEEGRLQWDSDNGTLTLGMPGGDVNLQVGQELVFRGKCDDAGDISNGAVVYVSDATGGVPLVKAITGTSDFDIAHRVYGVATEDITYNQIGYVTFFGLVRDINTSGLTEGEPVFVDTDGSYTNTPPSPPNAQIYVGITLKEHATEGVMGVNTHTVHRIDDLSGVNISSIADKDTLTWNETEGYWENSDEPTWQHVNSMSGRLWGGFITDNGDGSVTVSAGQGLIKEDEAGPEDVPTSLMEGQGSKLSLVSWAEDTNVSCADDAYNYLYYDGSSGTIQSTVDFYSISFTQDFTVGRVYRSGTTVTIRLCGTNLWNFDRRVQLFGEEVFPILRAKGMMLSETGARYLAVTAGVLWAEAVNRFSTDALDTSSTDTFTYWYRDGSGGWTASASQQQIDNTQYDDGDGTLGTLTANRYGVHWVYMVHDSTLHVVYGQGDYTLSLAQDADPPGTIPGLLAAYSTLIAKIIVQKSDTNLYSIEYPWTTTFTSSGVTNHNDLTGLQGGTTDEYYHLTSAENTAVGNLGDLSSEDVVTAALVDSETATDGYVLTADGSGGAAWEATGDVVGPGSATDNAIARFHETTGKIIQNSGVTVDDSDNITAPAEIYMGGGLGLKRRIIDNITATISDDFHFRSGSYPTGWSWQTTGIWNSPTSLEDNDFYGEYLAAYGGTCFFASTVTTYLNKSIYARFAPGGEIGLRLQADDTHYYQIRLTDLSTGLMQIYVDYDDGGGIVTATKTTFPIWQSVVCRLYCLQSGANHYGGFYLVNELGGGVVRFITAVKTWTPTKVGFISLTSGLGYVDWMSSDFT